LPRVAVLAGALAIAALALFMLPWLLGFGGGGAGSSPTPGGSRASASPTATVTAIPSPSQETYTIKSKDTLLKIAKMFGVTLEQLLAANPQITNPNVIGLGQVIVIPSKSASSSAAPSGSAAP
jgi:LysM repeat protein